MNTKSIFEYENIKSLLNRIQSLITSNSLLRENLEDNDYWQVNNSLFRTTRNLTLSKFTEKDLNIFREIVGLNTNEFKEIYTYSFLLNDLSSLISEHLLSLDFNKDLVEFLNYLWFNPTFKYNVSQLNFLNLDSSFYFPSVFVFDDKSKALSQDIEYIKNVLFKAHFDNDDQIINVQTLAWNNTYKNLTDWQNILASEQPIKNKQDWDTFFYKDNVTINNLESLLDKTSLAQNGDFLEVQFQNNVFNPLKIDKNIFLDVQQHYSYFSILYWSGLVLLIVLITLIVLQRVEKKDIL